MDQMKQQKLTMLLIAPTPVFQDYPPILEPDKYLLEWSLSLVQLRSLEA